MTRPVFLLAMVLALAGCARPMLPEATSTLVVPAAMDDAHYDVWQRAERERITQARQAADARYQAEELDCWQRFAVNDCLRDARRARRVVQDRMRQEELTLKTEERARQTRARQQAIDSKGKAR